MPLDDYWEHRADAWTRRTDALATRPDPYGDAVLTALAPQPGERILDIGCGPALGAIAIAHRVGPTGAVTAVDVSATMLTQAARRIDAAVASDPDLAPITLLEGDAQTIHLGTGFDAAHSRFGVMFFDDPVDAFTNITAALRPGGRVAFVVWGTLADNPWATHTNDAAARALGRPDLTWPHDRPGPFALGDPAHTTTQLTAAGFDADTVDVTALTDPRRLPAASVRDDLTAWLSVGPVADALDSSATATHEQVLEVVFDALAPFRDDTGYTIPACAYIVTATLPA